LINEYDLEEILPLWEPLLAIVWEILADLLVFLHTIPDIPGGELLPLRYTIHSINFNSLEKLLVTS